MKEARERMQAAVDADGDVIVGVRQFGEPLSHHKRKRRQQGGESAKRQRLQGMQIDKSENNSSNSNTTNPAQETKMNIN